MENFFRLAWEAVSPSTDFHKATALESSGNWIEMHVVRSHSRPIESVSEEAFCVSTSPPGHPGSIQGLTTGGEPPGVALSVFMGGDYEFWYQ